MILFGCLNSLNLTVILYTYLFIYLSIIHIEAEGTPENTIEKAASISIVTPRSLNFLDTDEQQRVRKLLDSLKSSEAKDMDTQTRELGKYFEKCVQTECLNPCNCSGMTSYL